MWGIKTQKSPVMPKMSQFCHVHSLVATLDVTAAAQPGQVSTSGRSPQTRGRGLEGGTPAGVAGGWRTSASRGAPSPAGREAELMAMGVGECGAKAGSGDRERGGEVVVGKQGRRGITKGGWRG